MSPEMVIFGLDCNTSALRDILDNINNTAVNIIKKCVDLIIVNILKVKETIYLCPYNYINATALCFFSKTYLAYKRVFL